MIFGDNNLEVARKVVVFLDHHEGFFMVVLTAALVFIAWRSAKIALKSLDVMKKNDADRTRPYIALEVVDDRPFYGVRMRNSGQTAARNIVVKSCPEMRLVFSSYNKQIKFLSEPVKYFPPNGCMQTDIGAWRDIENANPEKTYAGTISYEDESGNSYQQDFVLDFSVFTDSVHKSEKTIHDVAQQLEKFTREFGHFASGFHKPHVLVEDYLKYEERVAAIVKAQNEASVEVREEKVV